MKAIWTILLMLMTAASAALVLWVGREDVGTRPSSPADSVAGRTDPGAGEQTGRPALAPLRIGLVPERDIFEQRKRYRALGDYLAGKLNRPVELATLNSYQAILSDFQNKEVDVAFLGSFVAALTMDRLGAHVLAKPIAEGGGCTYRGVIFVPESSPIRGVGELAGRSVAMVKYTTAGHLFPIVQMVEHHLLVPPGLAVVGAPRMVWVGTHDQVADEVMAGRVEAGSIKDLRLDAWQRAHPQARVRRLAVSPEVPENALVIRADLFDSLGSKIRAALLGMAADSAGTGPETLRAFGAVGFGPCECAEYQAVFDMASRLGQDWDLMQIAGPPPWCACTGTPRPAWSRTPSSQP